MPGSDRIFEPEVPTFEGSLDALFAQAASNWRPGIEAEDLPSNLAARYVTSLRTGLEVVKILNWESRQKIEIVRPTLDSPNNHFFDMSVGKEPDVLYRIITTNLFGTKYVRTKDEAEKIALSAIKYDVFSGRIALWGIAESLDSQSDANIDDININDEEAEEKGQLVYSSHPVGTVMYANYASNLIDLMNLDTLVTGFELIPTNLPDNLPENFFEQ